jgi:hypothetical protein
MKLMTEMQDGCVHASGYCVDEECVDSSEAERLIHDAAAAHALMQAIIGTIDSNSTEARANAMIRRADELMREWGFGREGGK